jgi:hypothetical protein
MTDQIPIYEDHCYDSRVYVKAFSSGHQDFILNFMLLSFFCVLIWGGIEGDLHI